MTTSNALTFSDVASRRLALAGLLLGWGLLAACGGSGGPGLPPQQLGACTDADPFACEAQTPDWATAVALDPRSIDGTGNNIANPEWGAAQQPVRRTTTNAYGDGQSTLARATEASPRLISNIVCFTPILASGLNVNMPNARGASDFIWQWGQFLDHDLSFTTVSGGVPESAPIAIPKGDPYFDPQNTGTKTMTFLRSNYVIGSVPRQQININTSFIDASMVYGSDATREMALRANDGTGRLETSPGNLPPINTTALINTNPNNPGQSGLFMCGDIRCNEVVGLTSLQVLFLREHNRVAGLIHNEQPQLNDEEVFQLARAVIAGESAHITYDTYLPILLGPNAIPAYSGYKSDVDPRTENMFTILFRVGHTMLSSNLQMDGPTMTSLPSGPLSMANAFFHPEFMTVGAGLEPALRGMAGQHAQEVDLFVVKEVQSFLFDQPNVAASLDLPALNIQRGRDHGLGSYTQTEQDYGLPVAASFADVTSDTLLQAKLAEAYPQGENLTEAQAVAEIDPWVGALAEDHVPGAMVGPLLEKVLSEQFIRTRDGDRYWYENTLPPELLAWVKTQTLAKIIRRNTTIGDELPENVFLVPQLGQ